MLHNRLTNQLAPAPRPGSGDVFAHLHRMADAATPEELWTGFLSTLSGYGFTRATYGATRLGRPESVGNEQDIVFFSNAHAEPLRDHVDIHFFLRTPMLRWALENVGVCSWAWAQERRRAGLLTPEELAAQDMGRRAGLHAGYTISFPDPSPRNRAALGISPPPEVTQDQVDALWARHGDEILTVCQMMHLKMLTMPLPVRRRPLSPRQREALGWVAEGKTSQDIATIMSISPAMVEKHLRLAREALDVETTAHAVAKALIFNQLFFDDRQSQMVPSPTTEI